MVNIMLTIITALLIHQHALLEGGASAVGLQTAKCMLDSATLATWGISQIRLWPRCRQHSQQLLAGKRCIPRCKMET